VDAPDTTTTAAELGALVETLRRTRDRVTGIAEPYLGSEREDLVAALYEAERHVRAAERALDRALKLTGG
jgi:3-oxoacyl-[acyl-carrier-protein] synthase III